MMSMSTKNEKMKIVNDNNSGWAKSPVATCLRKELTKPHQQSSEQKENAIPKRSSSDATTSHYKELAKLQADVANFLLRRVEQLELDKQELTQTVDDCSRNRTSASRNVSF